MEKPRSAERSLDQRSLDLSSSPNKERIPAMNSGDGFGSRAVNPFLGINFQCCRTYGRVYRNQQRTAYVGFCPKCGAKINVPIGGGGTSQRFFNAE